MSSLGNAVVANQLPSDALNLARMRPAGSGRQRQLDPAETLAMLRERYRRTSESSGRRLERLEPFRQPFTIGVVTLARGQMQLAQVNRLERLEHRPIILGSRTFCNVNRKSESMLIKCQSNAA